VKQVIHVSISAMCMLLGIGVRTVRADELADKYGVGGIVISDEEKERDQKYGGFPNNSNFNNETKCRKVLQLFDTKGIGPTSPKMVDFLKYSRVKLMEFDITWEVMHSQAALIDSIEPKTWQALPAVFPAHCRRFPDQTLEQAASNVYRAARITFGPGE
jgi:hypothetical protein